MIDVNETRFHLLLGRADWLATDGSVKSPLEWDEESQSIGLPELGFRFPPSPREERLTLDRRRGAGRDRYGNWYWIDEHGREIRFLSTEQGTAEHFWRVEDMASGCPTGAEEGDFRPRAEPTLPDSLELRGLTVTQHHYLVVGVLQPAGVLIFDLYAGGPPTMITWPSEIPFAPFDLAPAVDGGVWILDRQHRQYWLLDRRFRVCSDLRYQLEITLQSSARHDFQPLTGPVRESAARLFPAGISLELASPLEACHPAAIEGLPDGSVLILDSPVDSPYSSLYRCRFGRQLGAPLHLERILEGFLDPEEIEDISQISFPFALKGHDMAFVPSPRQQPGRVSGRLFLVATDGNQAFAFDLEADDFNLGLDLQKKYFPLRLFSGKALVAVGSEVYYDLQERWLPLTMMPRPRYQPRGVLLSRVFDGREPGCVWHRLLLDACIPPQTAVKVESRAADELKLLESSEWQTEPLPYLRQAGPEIPYYQAFSADEATIEGTGTWELLLQNPRARYLQLRLTLTGNRRKSPRLRTLRVYYPRFSFVGEYLPAVYQEYDAPEECQENEAADNTDKRHFLERYLANMEGIFTTVEGKIEQAQVLFDVDTVPARYLDWLAAWFGVMLESKWEEERKRLFIAHILEFFNQRGTTAGLIRAIRLATDPCPDPNLFEEDVLDCRARRLHPFSVRIVEGFLTRRLPGVVYGDPTDLGSPGLMDAVSDWQWTPRQGADPLHRRYRDYLRKRYGDIQDLNFEEISLSPVCPKDPKEASDWRQFLKEELTFSYAPVCPDDLSQRRAFREFLGRRYRQVARLNTAYGLKGDQELSSFDQVDLPEEMPPKGARLLDWIQFVSLVLPIKSKAHRFTVLLPVDPQTDEQLQQRQLDLVTRIVKLEKPAHTTFEVKPYWALFRVGEARVGLDTLMGMGSRFFALVLGHHQLGQGFLAPPRRWQIPRRRVLGRDGIGDISIPT
jgi:phage tail-like protein